VNLGILAAEVARTASPSTDVADIVTFIESPWGLGMKLFPVQRVILKAHYGIALDDNPLGFPLDIPVPKNHPNYDVDLVDGDGFYALRIPFSNWHRENHQVLTEAGYLKHLFDDGRCNVDHVVEGHERREMILSIGRRSGKTTISACIAAYETYKLISKGHPQSFYGLPDSNVIQIISVATDKDQAGLLYRECHGHFVNCDFFAAYMANATQSFATFQTPHDIEKFGPYSDNPRSRFSLKITFRSCVAKGLRGAGNIVVILDEVAHFTDKGQSGAEEVYNAVTPSTSAFSRKDPLDSRKPIGPVEGRIILISSPLGKQGQFYKLFQIGMSSSKAANNMLCIEAPTWEVNPTVPASEFEKHYIKDPAVFFTEYGGEFTDRTRGWIESEEDLLACVVKGRAAKHQAPAMAPHFMGVDVALVGDYTTVAIGHNAPDGKVILDHISAIKAGEGEFVGYDRLEFDDVASHIENLAKRFYIVEGIFDQWAGIPLEQALKKRGLSQLKSVHHTRTLSSQMYQNFKNMMLDKKLELYDHPIAEGEEHSAHIKELLELQAETVSKYIIKVEAPNMQGKHDDYSDSLVRMVWCATTNSTRVAHFGSTRGVPNMANSRFGTGASSTRRGGRSGTHPSRTIPKKGRR
jgi:hypothetical protein